MTERNAEAPLLPTARAPRHRWFAALYDRMSRAEERGFLGEMRRSLVGGLRGDVLEIGAGTGNNFAHYAEGARVLALEPDPYMRKRAEAKLAGLGRANIVVQAGSAEQLPADDASTDAVVSTLVLCTVSDVPRALAEIRRVLKPGGRLVFIEHVRADGLGGRLQDVIKPAWGWFGAGCHPNRRTVESLRAAGFAVDITERAKMMGFVPVLRGVAGMDG